MIYSSRTSFDNRGKDPVFADVDGTLCKLQDYKYDVGKYVFKLPLEKIPPGFEVHPKSWTQPLRCIFYEERTQNKPSV